MSFWNFGGLNPSHKEFLDKHPDITMLGMSWALYWRFMVVVLVVELAIFLPLMAIGLILGRATQG